jgi:glycosyltransferase involved in cell wall biosynthesis
MTPDERPPHLSLVLPAFNEVGLLGSTVTNLITGLDTRPVTYEIVIVENGSRDGTLRLARLLAAQLDHIRVLSLPRGNYGAALVAGFRAARGDIVVNFDVDYYDLGFLDAAVTILEAGEADIVLASKRVPDAQDRRPLARRALTFGFTTLLRVIVDLPVSDAHGMKAIGRHSVASTVERCRLRGSIFDVELVCKGERDGLRFAELPAFVAERRPPRSSVVIRSLEALWSIGRLWYLLRSEQADGEAHATGEVLARRAAGLSRRVAAIATSTRARSRSTARRSSPPRPGRPRSPRRSPLP